MMASGTWSVTSATDPRWDGCGRCLVGNFIIPVGARDHIEDKKQELRELPPPDLTYSYMKD